MGEEPDIDSLERELVDMSETLRQAMVILEDFEEVSLSNLYSKLNSVVRHAQQVRALDTRPRFYSHSLRRLRGMPLRYHIKK